MTLDNSTFSRPSAVAPWEAGGSTTFSSEEEIWRGKLAPVSSDTALGPQMYTDGIFLGRLLTHISVVGPFTVRTAVTNGLCWAVRHTDRRVIVKKLS